MIVAQATLATVGDARDRGTSSRRLRAACRTIAAAALRVGPGLNKRRATWSGVTMVA
jgi:hypothetical protein